MSYKNLIKSRSTRLAILRLMAFIPDKTMIKLQYRIKLHRKLNLKKPKRFTEKLQWYKLYYRDSLMAKCADKFDVREYVKECGLEDILVPIIGIYDKPEQINFAKLPKEFVAKDTLGGGGNSVIICKNKEKLDILDCRSKMRKWVKTSTSFRQGGREWVYGGKKHRIIIEQFLPSDEKNGGLIDYKFFCFYGKPEVLYVIADRIVGQKAGFGVFNPDTFEQIDVERCDEKPLERKIEMPDKYDEMLQIAKRLSKPFPEARIDLYCVEGKVYFGEITFFDGSGYMSFNPDSFDYEMGDRFRLPERNK